MWTWNLVQARAALSFLTCDKRELAFRPSMPVGHPLQQDDARQQQQGDDRDCLTYGQVPRMEGESHVMPTFWKKKANQVPVDGQKVERATVNCCSSAGMKPLNENAEHRAGRFRGDMEEARMLLGNSN